MLTNKEILFEYGRCWSNPIYAIETYLTTFDKTNEGYVPFVLFPKQKDIILAHEANKQNLITKPRQAGVSTTVAAYLSVKAAFADEDNPEAILILANKQDMAQEFLQKIKEFLVQYPRWVWGSDYYGTPEKESKSIFLVDSRKELKLPNGTRLRAVATSKTALRGYTPTRLVIDEAAFIDEGEEVFTAAMAALGTGGHCTLISTPNGLDELYYKTYEQAKSGRNRFNVVELKWYEDLRYNKKLKWIKGDEEINEIDFTLESFDRMIKTGYKPTSPWYEDMCKSFNNNEKKIAQELDVSFIGSGGNVIADEHIQFHEKHNVMDPVYVKGDENEIFIWKLPEEGHQYILGGDVSRGDGEDFTTIVIIDITTMEQVMEYQGKIQPDLFAYIVYEYGELYKALSVIDITGGIGVTTVLKLQEMGYKRLYYSSPNEKLLESSQKKLKNLLNKDNMIPGFTVGNHRVPMISHLEQSIRENTVKIRSVRLTSEMKTFIYKKGRADHMSGFHDDLLMALAMALYVVEFSYKNLERMENQTKAILSSWGVAGEQAKKFNSNNNNINRQQSIYGNNMNIQDPRGEYLWLFSKPR